LAQKTAIFRQINKNLPHTHHDALEFSDGRTTLLTYIWVSQEATVRIPLDVARRSEMISPRIPI
jgi:hypothetical protein